MNEPAGIRMKFISEHYHCDFIITGEGGEERDGEKEKERSVCKQGKNKDPNENTQLIMPILSCFSLHGEMRNVCRSGEEEQKYLN